MTAGRIQTRIPRTGGLRPAAARWRRLGTVEQVRSVFGVVAVVTVLSQLPNMTAGHTPILGPALSSLCALLLVAVWLAGLRARRFLVGVAVVEAIAMLGVGLGLDHPHRAFVPVYTMLFFRTLYGSHWAALGRVLAYGAVLFGVFALTPGPATLPLFIPISLIVMTVTMRILAVCLDRIAQASEVSASLARTAGDLLTATNTDAVRDRCEEGARQLAPDARVRVVLEHDRYEPEEFADALRFDLNQTGSAHGALMVWPRRPLPVPRRVALQTMAAQASAALESLELRAQLSYRASHDALTGLPNRSSYTDALGSAIASGAHCAALFIDLDDFKTVNDTLGHAAGDALLVQVASRIRGALAASDVAARLGGDEFAILIHDREDVLGAATTIAGRALAALEEPFDLGGTPLHVRCSIGVAVDGLVVAVGGSAATSPRPLPGGDEVESATVALLRNADIAMYVAKTRGKNRFEVFAPEMASDVAQDLDVRQELASALTRNEFELYFQPIVALPSHEVRAVEALIRWHHPKRGLLPPGAFLPLAEQTRLLADIERWVIVTACREAAKWEGADAPAVTVNISPRHLSRRWLVPTVTHALTASGLPGNRLTLEITEEALIFDPAAAEANLRACVKMGVQIAVDDFGAGHASLGSLRSLPVSTVKMDRSLIIDEDGQRVVNAVVGLAHALGLQVVAEGVETGEQLRRVRDSGCDAVQGFLFARPAPANTLDLRAVTRASALHTA
jgi:diguanylate cyclase (GGDEF)-like protein